MLAGYHPTFGKRKIFFLFKNINFKKLWQKKDFGRKNLVKFWNLEKKSGQNWCTKIVKIEKKFRNLEKKNGNNDVKIRRKIDVK